MGCGIRDAEYKRLSPNGPLLSRLTRTALQCVLSGLPLIGGQLFSWRTASKHLQ
jgi:hypothetical protein